MMMKFLLSKKYREDCTSDLIIQSNEADKQVEKIYENIASEISKNSYAKIKKAS